MRGLLIAVFVLAATPAAAKSLTAEQKELRAVYQELVEINTTEKEGSTLKAAQAMAARLKSAGFGDADVMVLQQTERKGNVVARLKGTGKKRPLLLLAHLDVVEAKREHWETDPFKLVEKGGYFTARGTLDDKAMAAVFVANLMRYKREGYVPDRDIIMALTTDEETPYTGENGVAWLLARHRNLIDAEIVLNEGAGGALERGKPLYNSVQTGEKIFANVIVEVKNPGGHSSVPEKDNAIYRLAAALTKIEAHAFPVRLNDTTRAFFERSAAFETGQTAADMKAIVAPTPDPAAVARLSEVPRFNALMRTTCVATRLEAGHADNALPQSAKALVNCRVLPGESGSDVLKTLTEVVGDKDVTLRLDRLDVASPVSPASGEVMTAIEKITADMWPGIPVLPVMSTGATDARFLRNGGMVTYGTEGMFMDRAENRAHGKDERLLVKSLYEGQDYLDRLIRALAGGAP